MGDFLHNEIPTTEPEVLRAGDTWEWKKYVAGHLPGDGWVLKYGLHNVGSASASNTKLQITATTDGNNHAVSVSAATTAPLLPGNWKWVAVVEKGAQRFSVGSGVLYVEPDLYTVAAGTQQTHAEKMLEAIESVLEGRATSDIESYSIAGRAVNKIPIAELIKWHNVYLARVKRERNPGKFGTRHLVKFTTP